MRLGIGAILSLIAIGCAGCASQPAAPIVAAIAPGQTKITITRTDTPASIANCAVQIDVNGNHLTELAPGQSFTGGVPAGSITLTAWQALDMGQYKLDFKAVPGKTYAFEVSPRIEHRVAAAVFGLSGLFAETVVSGEHSGGFQITPAQ
jgi:hypothetical protein